MNLTSGHQIFREKIWGEDLAIEELKGSELIQLGAIQGLKAVKSAENY